MKSVEEWKAIWRTKEANNVEEHEAIASEMLKQIQLDAMKEGMRRAAFIASETFWNDEIGKAIFCAAFQLEKEV